jgi:dihydrolipoamide dehydrogenase
MNTFSCKVLVLGGGPGGYVAAIRAGQLGLDTVLVEHGKLGGTCLNVGCIPSKALIHAADEYYLAREFANGSPLGIKVRDFSIDFTKTIDWKDKIVRKLNTGVASLLGRAKVRVVQGWGKLLDGRTCEVEGEGGRTRITCENLIIASGSESVALPSLPFGERVLSSTEALSLKDIPARLAVIGGGYIGLELGIAFQKLGSQVTVIEAADRLLPHYDTELVAPVAARMKALGIEVRLNARAESYDEESSTLAIATSDGATARVEADRVLVTVGRRPMTRGFGLESLVLSMNGGAIAIDNQCRTSMRHVWAIGDVTGEPMLAHRAMAQGEMVAEIIAGHKRIFDKAAIPAVCFTDPEIVTVGLTPDAARAAGEDVVSAKFPLAANGRSLTMEADTGFVRLVARKADHAVVGVQAVGKGVSELSASFSLAVEMNARAEDIAATIHAHPTVSESFQESALKLLGHALHA